MRKMFIYRRDGVGFTAVLPEGFDENTNVLVWGRNHFIFTHQGMAPREIFIKSKCEIIHRILPLPWPLPQVESQ